MVTTEYIITSLSYPATPASLPVTELCHKAHSQACFHYSSAMANNAQWATLTCPVRKRESRAALEDRPPGQGLAGSKGPWNKAHGFPKYDYKKPYSKGKNGS